MKPTDPDPRTIICGPRIDDLPDTSDDDALNAMSRIVWDGRSLLPGLEKPITAKELKKKFSK